MDIKIDLLLERDSVCMADDFEDHKKGIEMISFAPGEAMIMRIANDYLPMISGRNHHWDVLLNGKKVARIKGNCQSIVSLNTDYSLVQNDKLYFRYYSAID